MTNQQSTVQDLADAFVRLDSGEGWSFAVLVACGVERGVTAQTIDRRSGKVTVREFARMTGTSDRRIGSFLAAWDCAAEQGLCPPASELQPGDVGTVVLPDDRVWQHIFVASNARLRAAGMPEAEESRAVARLLHLQGEQLERETLSRQVKLLEEQLAVKVRQSPRGYQLPDSPSGHLYAIQDPCRPGELKLGYGGKPEDRLAEARTWLPDPVIVGKWAVPNMRAAEAWVHVRLAAERVGRTEWFRADLDQVERTVRALLAQEAVAS